MAEINWWRCTTCNLQSKNWKGDMPSSKECLSQNTAIKCLSYTSWQHKRPKQTKIKYLVSHTNAEKPVL